MQEPGAGGAIAIDGDAILEDGKYEYGGRQPSCQLGRSPPRSGSAGLSATE